MEYGNVVVRGSFGEILKTLCNRLHEAPVVESRITKTKEMIGNTIVLTDPSKNLCFCEHRTFNFIYALVEASLLFWDQNEVRPFAYFNKKMLDYSDDGKTLNSAYGSFIAPHLYMVIEKLRKDSDTRQAVISIYNNDFCCVDSKDIPCTQDVQFLIRDGRLTMIVHMRSNDVFWGLQYDLYMFTNLQRVVAKRLGIECGPYIHMPTSLHVYDYHWDALEKIVADNDSIIDMPVMPLQAMSEYRRGMQMATAYMSDYNECSPDVDLLREAKNRNISNALILTEVAYKNMLAEEFKALIERADKNDEMREAYNVYSLFFKRWFRSGENV